MKTHEAAQGKWRSILGALGVPEKTLSGSHVPCPFCGGKDRFRFDDKEGRGTWFCSQCGAGAGIEFVKRFLNVSAKVAMDNIDVLAANFKAAPVRKARDNDGLRAACKRLWDETEDPRGTLVEAYLNKRGIGQMDRVGRDVRYHPTLRYTNDANETVGLYPAMVALIRDFFGKAVGLHRTYLSEDGGKADVEKPKKVLAFAPLPGSAVRLAQPGEVMGVAEGIETALAANMIHATPVWAALNANGVATFEPPQGIKGVLVFADNDASATGQIAAYTLKQRLWKAGIGCQVMMPKDEGKDWADVWAEW